MLGSRPVNARRLPTILLLLYLIFLAYGSISSRSTSATNPDAFARFLAHPVPRRLSLSDVAANLLLGAPFGVLMVWGRWAGASLAGGLGRVMVIDALLAAAVEAGQLFVPGRLQLRGRRGGAGRRQRGGMSWPPARSWPPRTTRSPRGSRAASAAGPCSWCWRCWSRR